MYPTLCDMVSGPRRPWCWRRAGSTPVRVAAGPAPPGTRARSSEQAQGKASSSRGPPPVRAGLSAALPDASVQCRPHVRRTSVKDGLIVVGGFSAHYRRAENRLLGYRDRARAGGCVLLNRHLKRRNGVVHAGKFVSRDQARRVDRGRAGRLGPCHRALETRRPGQSQFARGGCRRSSSGSACRAGSCRVPRPPTRAKQLLRQAGLLADLKRDGVTFQIAAQ